MSEYIDCATCDNDGWIDLFDEEGHGVIGAAPCPHANDPDHPPFDYRSLLDPDSKR